MYRRKVGDRKEDLMRMRYEVHGQEPRLHDRESQIRRASNANIEVREVGKRRRGQILRVARRQELQQSKPDLQTTSQRVIRQL